MQKIIHALFLLNLPAHGNAGAHRSLQLQPFPFTKLVPTWAAELVASKLPSSSCYFVAPDMELDGVNIRVHFLGIPYTSTALLNPEHRYHTSAKQRLSSAISDAITVAGVQFSVIGLGAATAIALGHGRTLFRQSHKLGVPLITSGNTITAALAVEIARTLVQSREIVPDTISVVGGFGSVGSRVVEYAAQEFRPDRIKIVARSGGNLTKLQATAPNSQLTLCNLDEASQCPLMFCASSGTEYLDIDPDNIPKWSIIVDIGKPSNTNPMLAKQRPDVYIADGSLAKLPQKAEWAKICHRLGLPYNVVFGCLAETIVLGTLYEKGALCEHYGKSTFIGNPDQAITELVMEQLWRNGMKPFVTPAHR